MPSYWPLFTIVVLCSKASADRALVVRGGPARITGQLVDADANEVSTVGYGGVAGISYEQDVTDALYWRIDSDLSLSHGPLGMANIDAGLIYRFDVLRYVPYAGVGLGGMAVLDDEELRLTPALSAVAGLDVLRSRSTSWGIEFQSTGLLANTTRIAITLRWGWRWNVF